jgi:hypothetical protein
MDVTPTQPPPLSEPQVEARLRMLLGVLNRRLNRLYLIMGASCVLAAPVAVCLLVEVWGWSWWTAIPGGVGGSAALIATMPGVLVEAWLARRSARAFNAHFPNATPERALALKMLSQMRTFRRKAESALSMALEALSPADAVALHKVDPEGAVQGALGALGASPAALPAQPPLPAVGQGPPVVRSGGAYDYIPLEPRSPGEQATGPAAAEPPPAWIPLEPRSEPHEERRD